MPVSRQLQGRPPVAEPRLFRAWQADALHDRPRGPVPRTHAVQGTRPPWQVSSTTEVFWHGRADRGSGGRTAASTNCEGRVFHERPTACSIRTSMCEEKIRLFENSPKFGFKYPGPDSRGLPAVVYGGGQTESKMCRIALATLVVAGFGFVGASGAFAAPANGAAIAELGHQTDQVIQVRDSCGIGRHRRFGHCVPGCGQGWYQPYPGARCRPR